MAKDSYKVPVFVLGLLMGTVSTIVVKALYQSHGQDKNGREKFFEKPLFMTFVMFFGMTFALPLYYLQVWWKRRKASAAVQSSETIPLKQQSTPSSSSFSIRVNDDIIPIQGSGNNNEDYGSTMDDDVASPLTAIDTEEVNPLDDPKKLLDFNLNVMLFVPSFFDLLGSALSTIGLLYTSVSIYQLTRCTVIIVTAILKASALKHTLTRNMWIGVTIITISMALVGGTALMNDEGHAMSVGDVTGTAGNAKVGIMFILASCLVQGAQYVFEESMLTLENVPPLILVGMEGFWGVVLSLLVVFPVAHIIPGSDNGVYEDIPDAAYLMFNNSHLFWLMAIFCLIIFLYNVFCIYITFLLNSIWHAIMDNCRPVAVWAAGLVLYYTTGLVGEPWKRSSWLELFGMMILFYGTAVYNGTIGLPGITTDEEEEATKEHVILRDTLPATPMFHAAPATKTDGYTTMSPVFASVNDNSNNNLLGAL